MEVDASKRELPGTATPAPPPTSRSWQLHRAHLANLPRGPVDLWLIGDSLVEQWPDGHWEPWRVLNWGIGGDKTQHVLWRVCQNETAQVSASRVLLLVGSNNIGQGDPPGAVAQGIECILRRLAGRLPRAHLCMIEPPPFGPNFQTCVSERQHLSRLLRQTAPANSLNLDEDITAGSAYESGNYQEDGVHFTEAGYRLLTGVALRFFNRQRPSVLLGDIFPRG